MTRRLGGIGQRSLTVLATFSLAATLAGGLAMVGCGGDSASPEDGGGDVASGDGKADVTVDAGVDTGMIDTGKVETAPPCPTIAPPTFMPATGATVTLGSTVTIVPPGMPAGATVFYTLDSTLPVVGGLGTKVYSGPIQLGTLGAATINAVAAVQNSMCPPSVLATATYTVATGDGGSGPPIFTPPSVTQSNDFLVSLTSGMATTVCFTTDGTTPPTCDKGTGKCTGTSQTYNAGAGLGAAGSVTINGGVTNAATGKVTVQALACTAGSNPSAIVSQTYTLQSAPATMQGPAPGNLAFNTMGYLPTMGSATNGATLRFTTDGSPATCATGTLLTIGIIGTPANPGTLPVRKNITYHGVACKPGYAPSADATFGYTVTLAPMPFVDSTSVAPGALIPESTGTYDRTFTVSTDPTPDTYLLAAGAANPAGPAAGLYACVTTNGMTPACAAAANTCTTGTFTNFLGGAMSTILVSTTGEVVKSVACSPNFNASEVATATYTLQLDQPGLWDGTGPGCAAVPPAMGVVKCNAASGPPVLSYQLPAAGTDPQINEWIGTPPVSAITWPTYGFACAIKGGTPVCGAAGCTTGTSVSGGAFQGVGPLFSSAGLIIAAGDSWSVVGCPGAVSPGFLPSKVTTVTFSAPGTATAPTITPLGATFNTGIAATIMNQDTSVGSYICWNSGGTAVADPVCGAAGACTTGAPNTTPIVPFGSSKVTNVNLAPGNTGGTGYTSAPTVTIAMPPSGTQAVVTSTIGFSVDSYTVVSGGSGCPATPTVNVTGGHSGFGGGPADAKATVTGASNSVTAVTIKTTPGSGFIAAPTVAVVGCTVAPVITANLAATGSVLGFSFPSVPAHGSGYAATPAVTITGGGGTGAAAVALLDSAFNTTLLESDPTVVKARACLAAGATVTQSPVVMQTYDFKLPPPRILDFGPPAIAALPGRDISAGGTFEIGNLMGIFETTTGFAKPFTGPIDMCVTFDGSAPTCACTAGTYVRQGSIPGVPPSWNAIGFAATEQTSATTFATGTSTVKAIACDPAQPQLSSDIVSATLTLQEQVPLVSPVGGPSAGAGKLFENIQGVTLSSFGNTVICYTTSAGAAPDCTPGSPGTCLGGSTPYTAPIQVMQSGTDIKAIACNATTKSAVTADNFYTMSVSPVVLVNNPGSTCSTSQQLGLDCALGSPGANKVCSTATSTANGPTHNGVICYSTDGTAVTSCQSASAPPGTVHGSITCFTTGAAGTNTVTLGLTANTTIHTFACLTGAGIGFNPSSNDLSVSFTPFAFTPVIDGNLVDWRVAAVEAATDTTTVLSTAVGPPPTPTDGYFAYDATNYYFAYSGAYTAATANQYITVYVGDGAATGGTVTLIPPDSCTPGTWGGGGGPPVTLPAGFNAKYAFTWPTDKSAAPTTFAWSTALTQWQPASFGVGVGNVAGSSDVEFLVSRANVGGITTPHVLGVLVSNHGASDCTLGGSVAWPDTWPQSGGTTLGGAAYSTSYVDNVASCAAPNSTIP